MKSTKTVQEAYAFLGLTLAFSCFVFWGPLAFFKIPTISFVSDVKGPPWAITLYLVGGFVPSLLAIFLTWKKEGLAGLRLLGWRIIHFKLGWHWYVFTFLIVIVGTAGQLTINKLLGNIFNGYLFLAQLGSFLPLLILGPLSEEIGWRGYALGRLQTRWNALTSSLIVGLVWALWHLPLFMMVGTSQHESGVPFIGFLIKMMSISILCTWLYNNTKQSLWSAILLHWLYTYATQVLSSAVTRSPLYNWLECLPYVVMAFVVVLIWKPQTLSRPQKTLSYTDNKSDSSDDVHYKKIKRLSIKSFVRKAVHIMLTIISILLACILILVGVLLLWSYPGKPIPFVDENGSPLAGSISEKVFVNINGVEQGMFIKSKDATRPVLLYLHGGMPDYFLTQKYPTGLEDYFTVVWWEQRGSGLSYSADIPPETMTLEQMISDTLEVTNYLRHRFHVEKIYMMGHSGGTFIGIQVAARASELYYAYIGVAQMSYQLKSEKLAYEYMLEQFKKNGNKEMVRKLEAAPVTMTGGAPDAYLALRDPAMHGLGIGTTHDMNSVITGIFLPSLACRDYTIKEKVNMWLGKSHSGVSVLWSEMLSTDLTKQVTELEIPVYFFEGIYDYTVSYTLAKEYFDQLKVPIKGFYTFEQSAHSPLFEEPEKMQRILQEDVLVGGNNLADTK